MAWSRRSWLPVLGVCLLTGALVEAQHASARAQEAWDAVYIANKKVGYIRLRVEPLKDKGYDLVRVRYDMVMTVNREKDQITMQHQWGTIEKPDGEILRLETLTVAGQEKMRSYGEVKDGQMHLVLSAGGQSQQMDIPWSADVRGPYAAELSLSREPLKPGESRDVKSFNPELNRVCTSHLDARDKEETTLGGNQKRTLQRVEMKVLGPDGKPLPGMQSTLWVDTDGQILKSFTDALGGVSTYRTTKEAAQAVNPEKLDLVQNTTLKVRNKITQSERTRDIVYRVTMKGEDPAKVFPTDRRQTVRKAPTGNGILLEVRTVGPNEGQAGPAQVGEEFSRPNALINSDDATVIELAHKAVGARQDPWDKARAIEKWVFDNMRKKNFSVGFDPAHSVARNLEGDCTEHSVLTAAMCRASGVPTRVAIGLVYADAIGGFGFHMWNEVYVNRRWVAIDATFDESDVDATHIKLSDSSLDGVAPFEAFLTVVQTANKTELEPVEIR